MLDLSFRLAKKVNCSSPDMNAIVKCLRSVPAHLVQAEADNISGDIGPPMTFAYVPVSSDANFFQVKKKKRLRLRLRPRLKLMFS